jgi:hypothetical protein
MLDCPAGLVAGLQVVLSPALHNQFIGSARLTLPAGYVTTLRLHIKVLAESAGDAPKMAAR